MKLLKKFLSDVDGSARGILIPEELYRSILASLGTGSVVGLLILVLQSILDHAGAIFPDPGASTLMTMLLTLVLDLLRRQNHPSKPSPGPDGVLVITSPSPDPAPPPA